MVDLCSHGADQVDCVVLSWADAVRPDHEMVTVVIHGPGDADPIVRVVCLGDGGGEVSYPPDPTSSRPPAASPPAC